MSDDATPASGDTDVTETPWASDLEEAFEDETQRGAVSDFLAKTVQPYVTKIEQDSRPDRDAARLWKEFNDSPAETAVQVSRELFGDEIADQFVAILQGEEGEPAEPKPAEGDEPVEATPAEGDEPRKIKFEDLPGEVQEAFQAQKAEEERVAYYDEIDRLVEEHADDLPKGEDEKPQLNINQFHPFVVATNGDFDAAYEGYAKWRDEAKEEFGIQVPDGEQVTDPPQTINSETRDSATKPPTEKEYATFDEAMDDFFEDQKTPPPTVGSA